MAVSRPSARSPREEGERARPRGASRGARGRPSSRDRSAPLPGAPRGERSDPLRKDPPGAAPDRARPPETPLPRTRDSRRRRARALVLPLLLACAALLGACAAWADTLVSTTGQSGKGGFTLVNNDLAQAFTTGSETNGYQLTGAKVRWADTSATGDPPDIKLPGATATVTAIVTDGLGSTATTVATLTNPGTWSEISEFTAPSGTTLSANTTYYLIIEGTDGRVAVTTATGEDSGAASGWSVANGRRQRADETQTGVGGTWSTESATLKISVEGHRTGETFACSAASMEDQMWTGTLTVGQALGTERGYGSGYGSLDDTTFAFGGTNYTIDQAAVFPGAAVIFSLGATTTLGTDAADLVLHIGAQEYALADASYAAGTNSYSWFTNIPTWNDYDRVCLALTAEPPAVSSVALTSAPGADNTYAIDDTVTATVTFDGPVDITGSPELELDFGGSTKAAACAAATNTTTMACEYEVAVGDEAAGGIAIAANKLTGGSIYGTGHTSLGADLDYSAVAIDAGHKVDGIRPTLVTTGDDAPTTSADGTQVILTFSEDLSAVDARNGIQTGGIGAVDSGSISGRTVTITLYSVATIAAGQSVNVQLAVGAVKDAAGNGNLGVDSTTVINAVGVPTVSGVALTSAPGADSTYAIGDTVAATVTFSEAVDIAGSPELELDFDGAAKAAACATGTNTTTMACEYEVAAGDSAPDGIAIAADKLAGGTIRATGSTTADADLDHVAVAIDAGHKVDGIRPTLVTTGADAPTTSTDGETVLLVFSEDIGAASHGDITIQANSATLSTTMASVAGTKVELTLTTTLTAAAANITVALAADAVDDAVGNGNLALAATGVTNAVGTAAGPTVTGIALTSSPTNAAYGIGGDIEVTVAFDAAVDIAGTPQLELDFDGTAKAASCATGTNTTTMVCEYEVAVGDSAPDGIAIAANKLTGGTVTATGSTTAADLDHGAVAIDADHKVDGIRPTLVTTGADAPTTSTDGTQVILTFSETLLSTVIRSMITIQANGVTLSTTAASVTGRKVKLTLTTALTATATNLTVSLASSSVFDATGNGILFVAATAVANAVDAAEPPGSLKARRGDGEVHLEWAPAAAVPGDPDLAHQLRHGAEGGELSRWRDIPRSAPGGPNARSRTVTGLDNGTRYAFEVRVRRGGSGFGTAAEIRQTPEAPRWSVSTNRRSVHEGEDVTLSIATSNAVGFYSAPEALTLAVIGEIALESGAVIDGADPEDFEIRVGGAAVRGYPKDITFLNFDSDPDREPFSAQHFDVEIPVGSTSLDVTVRALADDNAEEGQEHMSFMVFRGEELVNEHTWEGTGVNIESGDSGVVKQLAVADAEATEGEDPSLDFVVTLAPAAAWTVTVDYATHDGTARAGSDYTDTSGALTFGPGDTEKTVSVPVIDDTVEDTPETLTLRLSNADPEYNDDEGEREWGSEEAGVLIADAVATGTIRNTEDAADLSADFPESAFASKRHAGSDDRPQVVVAFSEAVAEFAADTPSASVTGASGLSVQPHAEDGLENAYIFFMTPDGDGDVTFALTANAACAAGGICTAGGTVLARVPAARTIAGPGGGPSSLSVADAEATEEGDGAMAFVVTLDPAARGTVTVDYATSDGSARAGDDYTATSGTLTFRAGETEKTISVPVADDTEEDGGETFALTLGDASGADLGDAEATGTIRDADATATPLTASFENLPASHDGSGEFTFRVEFSEDVGIGYAVLRDDAFAVTKGDVTGARRVDGRNDLWRITVEPDGRDDVTVTLPGDRACGETGAVCTRGEDPRPLSNSPSATVAGPTVAVTPTVGIADAGATEGDGAIAFAVTLDGAGADAATVDYATADGTADGDDYTATSGTLTFAAGTTSGTITVPIADDDVNEGDETFTVTLSNASGATLGTGTATGTIRNRYITPTASISGGGGKEGDDSAIAFAVTLDRTAAAAVTVDYTTSDGSATAGEDYTAMSGTLTFAAGATGGTITVLIADDNVNESDETFTVTLSNASGAALGTASATGTIENRNVTPLTASFGNVPAEHDGTTFVFHARFSEDPAVSYRVLRDESFGVTGGEVVGARRKDGRDDLREIHVQPSGHGDVTVSLPPTTDCDAHGAICTADGRPLSNANAATVRAMAALSAADAETTEGAGATLEFAVTVSRAAAGTVTVGYATSDGTAVAGTDYTSASGTLTFDPGETAGTVSVAVLDDSVDDGGETLTLTLSNASGARIADATATGTIDNADPLPLAWLVRFGRAASDHAVEAIGARFEDDGGGAHATFAGRRLWGGGARAGGEDAFGFGGNALGGMGRHGGMNPGMNGGMRDAFGTNAGMHTGMDGGMGMNGGPQGGIGMNPGAGGGQNAGIGMGGGIGMNPMNGGAAPGAPGAGGYRPALRDLLIGSSFLLSANGRRGRGRRVAAADGLGPGGERRASTASPTAICGWTATWRRSSLGADAAWNRWLAGISVAHTIGAGGFRGADGADGELDSALTAVHPVPALPALGPAVGLGRARLRRPAT